MHTINYHQTVYLADDEGLALGFTLSPLTDAGVSDLVAFGDIVKATDVPKNVPMVKPGERVLIHNVYATFNGFHVSDNRPVFTRVAS